MIRHVHAAARSKPVVSRASSSFATAARATTPASTTTQASFTVSVKSSPNSATTPSFVQDVAPALSYGAWTHANPHLTRRERVEGLRKFMQARGDLSNHHHPTPSPMEFADGCLITQPVAEAVSPGISCANQPRTKAERIAQIQRFADATRAVGKIDYSQAASAEPTATPDPIIVSPLPAGWRLSTSTGMPVFSYGEWQRSHDDSRMDRTSAARQFMRYVRQ